MNKQSSKIVVVQNQEEIKELSKLNAFIWGKEADPFMEHQQYVLSLSQKMKVMV